jgi:predicted kinase
MVFKIASSVSFSLLDYPKQAIGYKKGNHMPELVLIRGPSGFGKSTLANTEFVSKGFVHLEADQFFMQGDTYKFDQSKIASAHGWCQKQTELFLRTGKDVVVSNTFTKQWELQFYRELATKMGIPVKIIRMTKEYGNTHGVPESVVKQMIARMEFILGEEVR